MYQWKAAASPAETELLDHVTDFRLNLGQPLDGNGPDHWWSVLIVLQDQSIDAFIAAAQGFEQDLLVPVSYTAADRQRQIIHQPVAIFARPRLIRALNRRQNAFGVAAVHLGGKTPVETLDFTAQTPDLSTKTVADGCVLTAVIDDGIAIAHDLFRSGLTTTRIAWAATLGARALPGGTTSLGRTLEAQGIDALMTDETYNDLLDEPVFYQRAGIIDWTAPTVSPVAMRRSHGTHIGGLAAGQSMTAPPPNRPILCIALPSPMVKDTSGLDLLPILCLAFHMLQQEAARYRLPEGAPAPLVVNFSFGNSGGPHDGTGLFNQLFQFYFGAGPGKNPEQPAWLMLPAGNLNLSRLHGQLEADQPHGLDLSVLPDDGTPNVVEMWLPMANRKGTAGLVTLQVTTPNGQQAAITAVPGQYAVLVDDQGVEVARLACQHEGGETDRDLVTLVLAPTARTSGLGPVAPQGLWTIRRSDPPGKPPLGPIALWIRRDETLPGHRAAGRQAYFCNDDYIRFDRFGRPLPVDPPESQSPVRRSGTISGFATGAEPVVVAAFTRKGAEVSDYSAAGPLMPRDAPPHVDRAGPDVAALADETQVLRGVLSAGSASGSWVRLSGTSVATPRVTRAATTRPHGWDQSAREWIVTAAAQTPFELHGPDLDHRAGTGGIAIEDKP